MIKASISKLNPISSKIDQPGSTPENSAIVVGGGFGGMASALRLRALGFDVTLIDRMARLGEGLRFLKEMGLPMMRGPRSLQPPFCLKNYSRFSMRTFTMT